MYGARDVRVENVPDAHLVEATDAVVQVTHAAVCGSDLWPYRSRLLGAAQVVVMGHHAARIALAKEFGATDVVTPLDEVSDGYRAMDERESIKVMVEP
jgi:threonine dehydrogenase-like Zn-dependent dehydrogenase